MTQRHRNPRVAQTAPKGAQQGVATLLFIVFIALGLAAATASVLSATQGSQKLQYAEHTVTQAEMTAWAGVTLLSKAVAALPKGVVPTPGDEIRFEGAQPGLSAKYVRVQDGLFVFEVVGSSAGARSVLRTAVRPPADAEPAQDANVRIPSGATLRGTTQIEGSVQYTGSGPQNLYVLDGSLSLQGSVTGLNQVCATGDVTVGAAIQVEEVCSNANVTFQGGATVNRINAIGNVTLAGGAAAAIGDIHSNGNVSLTGGSAAATSILASGDVGVTGGSARATDIRAEGNINWTSSAVGSNLASNGTVNYRPSGTNVATDISAIGNVMLTSARNVRTMGATTLVGYYGQGISGRLEGQGLLGGSSWGSGGGAVVSSGTVGSIVSPYPASKVLVSIVPGYTVAVNAVVAPAVPVFDKPRVNVDAYALKAQANFAFLSVDASGNPLVKVSKVNGIADGNYYIANRIGAGENHLCKNVSGANCVDPLIKVCQGNSNQNRCFSNSNGRWRIEGKTMLPSVLWFEGALEVSSGSWVNTFLATGDVSTSGSLKLYSPNYLPASYTCRGLAHSPRSLQAWTAHGLEASAFATQLCSGSPAEQTGAAIGNIALLAGGFDGTQFVGGNISLGSSNEVFGSVLAGQYLQTGGSTLVGGALYSAGQGGSNALTGNRQKGSTTIRTDGGAPAYDPSAAPCMKGCEQPPGESKNKNNVVWAAAA